MSAVPHAAARKKRAAPEASGWLLAFEASASPMWLEDAATECLIAANDAALRRYGYTRERFLAMRLADLIVAGPITGPNPTTSGAVTRHRVADGGVIEIALRRSEVDLDGRRARLIVATDAGERHLQESEQRYRQLFEAAADGYWEIDAKGYFTAISPSFGAIFDVRLEDWIGNRLAAMPGVTIDPDTAARALTAMRQRQPVRDFVHTLQSVSDGRLRWIHANFVPFFDAWGHFKGYRGVSRDISAQVLAEQALRASEQHARQLYEIASDYYFEIDSAWCLTYLSPSYEKIFGVHPAEVLGKRLGQDDGTTVPVEMLQKSRTAIAAKQPFRDFVFSRRQSNGEIRWISASAMPVFDDQGKFAGLRGVGADVTARVVAERTAQLAERRLQNAVAYVSQAMVVYDESDCVVAFNKAFDDLHGGVFQGSPVRDGVAFAQISAWELRHNFFAGNEDEPALDLATLLERYETEHEHTYRLADGRWMLVAYRRLPDGSKVGLWTDVTALKSAETERRALEAQLLHSQKLEALGTLAGGVAHEINNALVPVVALSKLVARKLPEGSRERHNLGTILTAAERSRKLVEQILAFSRKDRETRARIPIDLGEVLGQSLQMLRATVPSSIHLDLEIAPSPAPVIIGDANQLQQVIVNLINNAAQAIGARPGRISACLKPDAEGGELRLAIADTGCGMDEATLARIFEPFFTTKPVGEGTGLGLAVVHGIVKEHGGRITAESAIGRGTRVEICLPVAPAASA